MLDHPDPAHAAVFAFCLFQLCNALMIVPHELGHAFFGWLVGYPPIAIVFGSGRIVFQHRFGGVHVRIGRIPMGGMTVVDVHEAPHRAARLVALTLGGVIANAAIGLAAYQAARSPAAPSLDTVSSLALMVVVVANALMVVTNLFPRSFVRDGHPMRSDGGLVLAYLRGQVPAIADCRAGAHAIRMGFAFEAQDFVAGLSEARALAAHASVQAHVDAAHIAAAAALCELAEPLQARDLLEPLLARADLDELLQALARNNLAWVCLLIDEPESRQAGLELSRAALAAFPWNEAIITTRVCLLAVNARASDPQLDEARRLLASLEQFHLNRQCRAYAALAQGLVGVAGNEGPAAMAACAVAESNGATALPLRVLQRRLASP